MDQLIALFREQNAVLAALANNGGAPATSPAADRPDRPSAPSARRPTAAQIAATVRAAGGAGQRLSGGHAARHASP